MPTDPLTGARVLVASPDPTLAVFLADNLSADGCRVVTAYDLPFAMAVLRGGGVDAVIVNLTGGAVDAVANYVSAPVMVLASPDALARTRASDLTDVLAKPFSYPELRIRLSRMLTRPTPPARMAVAA